MDSTQTCFDCLSTGGSLLKPITSFWETTWTAGSRAWRLSACCWHTRCASELAFATCHLLVVQHTGPDALLVRQVKYPENFFLLRGNHECASINRIYGFYDECKRRYNVRLWKTFTDCFNCLPVAALVDEKVRTTCKAVRMHAHHLVANSLHKQCKHAIVSLDTRVAACADSVHAWRPLPGAQVFGASQEDTSSDRCP